MSVSRGGKAPQSFVVGSLFDAFAKEASIVSALQHSVRTQSGQHRAQRGRGEKGTHDALPGSGRQRAVRCDGRGTGLGAGGSELL
jgi:hypothetical protein